MSKVSQASKDAAYGRGVRDGQNGKYNPPKGDGLVDAIFSPIDMLAGSPSTSQVAKETLASYNAGHAAGSRSK